MIISMHKYDLDTPCLVLDVDVLEGNIMRMQTMARAAQKELRPHAKTHKCSAIARRQIGAGAVGVCAAKISEAEGLVAGGVTGVLITGPIATPRKIERLMSLLKKDPTLMVVIDDQENAVKLNDSLRQRGLSLDVLVDIDVGLKRSGVAPEKAMELAGVISGCPSLRLRGIQAYAGQVQHIKSFDERRKKSLACMERAAEVFGQVTEAGFPCDVFTGGGTGTHDIDLSVPWLTDLQVGSYVVMDAEYMAIGCARNPDKFDVFTPSLTLLSSVVSANQNSFVTVDAGLKTLYRDGAHPVVLKPCEKGFTYEWFGDEYGMIRYPEGTDHPRPGNVIELVVSHCDPTINLFDQFYVISKDRVIDVWPIDLRGKSQ
jgi:D-serine deaminase-like pyridoxal phosphate-dependent protein